MSGTPQQPYVSRGGMKLAGALESFGVDVAGLVCADLGSNVGGFVDCLLRRGALKVYAVDTGYGVLAWTLRKDPRVVVMERTNAMHITLPEPVDLVTIDVAWTPQHRILPGACTLLKPGGRIITLIKPHYEAERGLLTRGVLGAVHIETVLQAVRGRIGQLGLVLEAITPSPIAGQKGNMEFLGMLRPSGERYAGTSGTGEAE